MVPKQSTAAESDPSRLFLGVLVAMTFVMNSVGRGVSESFAVFLLPVEKGLGVDRAAISATYSFYMLAYGVTAPFAGQLIDRFGARICYGVGLTSLGFGYFAAGWASSIWMYYLCVGGLGGLGAAAVGMVAASSLLSRWFTKKLTSISALPYAAVGAGMLLFPPLTQVLIDAFGWRDAHRALGIIALAFLPLLLLLPFGKYTRGSADWRAQRQQAAESGTTWTALSAMKTGAFRDLFLAYFLTSVAAYSVLPHSIAYLVERGFDPLVAASAFGFNGLMSAFGIIAMGWMADRFGWLPTVTGSFFSTMTGVACLLAVTVWPSILLVYGFVVGFGLMQGARGPILVGLVARIFSGGAVGTIFGALSMALGAGAAIGSLLSGLLHQWTGNYVAAFMVSITASAAGMATFWLSPSIRQERVLP
jgi:MFS family permease